MSTLSLNTVNQKNALVILPTYNEAENIERIIMALVRVSSKISGYNLEILVVDDNSPDGTGGIVKGISRTHSNIHLISGQKAGLGKAYIRGFKHGLKKKLYDVFVMMDADFSHNPASVPTLIKKIDDGFDYAIGSRYIHGGTIPGNWPLMRIINSRAANLVARTLVGIDKDITDITGGFKAIRRTAVEKINLNSIQSAGYFFQVNLLHEFLTNDFKVAEVPITFVDRTFGNSKMKMRDILEFIYRAYTLNPQSSARQLVRFCMVGAIGTLVNLLTLFLLIRTTNFPILLSYLIAVEVSIISNFFFNHYYTFKFTKRKDTFQKFVQKLFKFNIGALGGAALSLTIFTLLYQFAHIHYLFADLLAIVVSVGWNYLISTRVVWKIVDADS